jgi:hypothetical protein
MSESGRHRELRKFPVALTRRLAAKGYKIERRYVNFPSDWEIWSALERDEPIWVYQCWQIVRKTRQRARQARAAPTEKGRDASRRPERGGEEIQGGRKP